MQVYGAGGKTVPKKGRLGTGSYYPQGTPLYLHRGNVFPGINPEQTQFPQLSFGDTSRAGIATRGSTLATTANHPNKSQYNVITLPLAPATIPTASMDNNNMQPVTPANDLLRQPQELSNNSANGVKRKPNTYRTVFGASKSMASDTTFHPDPTANYKQSGRPVPGKAVEAVKKSAGVRSFAQQTNPLPKGGGMVNSGQQHRDPPASFMSHGNHWIDPHNSFIAGATTAAGGFTNVGRWGIVKKGVV